MKQFKIIGKLAISINFVQTQSLEYLNVLSFLLLNNRQIISVNLRKF